MSGPVKPKYGQRADGTEKGDGYFGPLRRPDGDVSTELSVGVDFGKGEVQIPALVPTLSRGEIDYLLSGGKPTREIVDKAAQFAIQRMQSGKPVFAQPGESYPIPASEQGNAESDFQAGFNNVRGSQR